MFSDNYNEDDTMICCRLWKGKNKTGIVLDSSRLRGSIANVFENALNFIERNTKTGWVKTEKGGRDEIRSYPMKSGEIYRDGKPKSPTALIKIKK